MKSIEELWREKYYDTVIALNIYEKRVDELEKEIERLKEKMKDMEYEHREEIARMEMEE